MAAPSIAATVTLNDASTTQTASISGTIPTTAQAGQMAVLVAQQNTGVNTIAATDGWELLSGPDRINNNVTTYLWARKLTSADPGSRVTVTASGGSRMQGIMQILSGAGELDGLVHAVATTATAATSIASPTVTTTVDLSAVLCFWAVRAASTSTTDVTVPGSQTEDAEVRTAFSSSPNDSISASHRTTPGAAGSYGGSSATVNLAATAIVYTVAVPPPVTAPAPTTAFEFAPTGSKTNGGSVPVGPYSVVTGPVTWDTAVKFKDLVAAAKCDGSSGLATLEEDLGSTVTQRCLVRVLRVEAFTAGTFTGLVRWRLGGTNIGEVRVTSAGTLILRDNTTGASLGTAGPITFGQPFRLEVDITASAVTARFYADPAADTPTKVLGPYPHTWPGLDRVVDGVSTSSGQTVARLLYAADGATANPSLSRWATSPGGGLLPGMRLYAIRGGQPKLLTLTRA